MTPNIVKINKVYFDDDDNLDHVGNMFVIVSWGRDLLGHIPKLGRGLHVVFTGLFYFWGLLDLDSLLCETTLVLEFDLNAAKNLLV